MSEETEIIMNELEDIKKSITEIQMTLENETNKIIQIIAKGHLNLSRKLNDALRVENEKEMLLLRVNRLENEIHRIKQRIEIIWPQSH